MISVQIDNEPEMARISSYKNITAVVQDWQFLMKYNVIALPHPSSRNNIWLKKNPWFAQQILPHLNANVSEILDYASS